MEKSSKMLQNEINILKQLNHKNIIKYIDSDGENMLVEYLPNGEIFDFVQKEKFSEDIARYYFH